MRFLQNVYCSIFLYSSLFSYILVHCHMAIEIMEWGELLACCGWTRSKST